MTTPAHVDYTNGRARSFKKKAKAYFVDHIPQIVMAASAVVVVVAVKKIQNDLDCLQDIKRQTDESVFELRYVGDLLANKFSLDDWRVSHDREAIDKAIDEGRDFTFYPGLGIRYNDTEEAK